MFGQTRKPRRAVLVMVDENGRVDGWEVFNATAGYELTGWPGGSAHGTITVSGEFHRMSRQLDLEELMPDRHAITFETNESIINIEE